MISRSHRLHDHTLTANFYPGASDSAPTVVMLHGLMESSLVWGEVIAELTPHFRCVTLDLPWNGTQGGLWGLVQSPEEWLRAAIEAFDLKPDAWVGHSFGASTFLSLLGSGRSSFHSAAPIVLISPFYKSTQEEITWPLFQRYVNEFIDFVKLSIKLRTKQRPVEEATLHRMSEIARDVFGCYVWTEFWRLYASMPFVTLEKISQPVQLVTGASDSYTPLSDVMTLANNLPDGRLEIYPDSDHFLLGTAPSAVGKTIHQFFTTLYPVQGTSLRYV